METIEEFVTSVIYQDALKEIKDKVHIEFLDFESENKETQLRQVLLIEEKLRKAELSMSFVSDYIQNNLKSIIAYSIQKIRFYETNSDKASYGEYPKGEELDEDEKPVTVKVLGYNPFTLIMYGVEYFFLNEHPDRLLEYIKKLRIPGASKYKKEITTIYKEAITNI